MKTLPHFRDLRDLLALIDGSHRSQQATYEPKHRLQPAAERDLDGFVDCRGVVHTWDEEDA